MFHRCLSVFLVPGLFLLAAGMVKVPTTLAGSERVTICHVPPEDPGNAHEIAVSERAIASHLRNHPGDVVGPCRECASGAECNDGNLCTVDRCNPDGTCDYSQAVSCEDSNPCTLDVCDPDDGCLNPPVPDGDVILCDDGNTCSSGDVCVDGVCSGEPVADCCENDVDCPEDDACTVRFCAENTCQEIDISNRCTAGACEVAYCDPATGCGSAPATCPDDGDFCTEEVCDPLACGDVGACVSQPNPNPPETVEVTCDDGLDNDCDGSIDFADLDCPECLSDADCSAPASFCTDDPGNGSTWTTFEAVCVEGFCEVTELVASCLSDECSLCGAPEG